MRARKAVSSGRAAAIIAPIACIVVGVIVSQVSRQFIHPSNPNNVRFFVGNTLVSWVPLLAVIARRARLAGWLLMALAVWLFLVSLLLFAPQFASAAFATAAAGGVVLAFTYR